MGSGVKNVFDDTDSGSDLDDIPEKVDVLKVLTANHDPFDSDEPLKITKAQVERGFYSALHEKTKLRAIIDETAVDEQRKCVNVVAKVSSHEVTVCSSPKTTMCYCRYCKAYSPTPVTNTSFVKDKIKRKGNAICYMKEYEESEKV